MFRFVHKIILRFTFALHGIFFALHNDTSFRLQFFLGILLLGFGYLVWPLSQLEVVLLVLSSVLVLITELQNTSFETALDRLHPEIHDSIRDSKNMAAGAVLIAGLFLLFVVLFILLPRIL